VPQLDQNSVGNQNAAIDISKNLRVAKTDEIVERTGIGNDDHASDYSAFVARRPSNVAISLSRSSTV